MSGLADWSQSVRWPSRALTELTFQVASLIKRGGAAAAQATEKELPQPQEEAAFGFFTWKDAPIMSSTKSISAPAKSPSEVSSTTSSTPSRSNTRSSGWRASSKLKPYWKPEQPPPDTVRRREALGMFSNTFNSLTRLAALALKLTRFSPVVSPPSAISRDSSLTLLLCGDYSRFVKPGRIPMVSRFGAA